MTTTVPDGNGKSVPLREYIETLFAERDRYYALRAESAKDALDAARRELDHRLEMLNNLRSLVESDRTYFVKQDVYAEKTRAYDAWCVGVNNAITKIETRSVTWTAALGVIFLLVQIAIHVFSGGWK